jgi:hypothetical protein
VPRTCSRTRPSTTPSYYNHQAPQLERLQDHSTTSADDQKAKVQRGATKQIVEKEEKKAEIWWGALEMLGDWSISFFSMKCKEIWRSFFFFFFLFSFVTCEQRLISLNWSALLLFQKNVRQYFKLSNSFTKTKKSWAWEVEHEIYNIQMTMQSPRLPVVGASSEISTYRLSHNWTQIITMWSFCRVLRKSLKF